MCLLFVAFRIQPPWLAPPDYAGEGVNMKRLAFLAATLSTGLVLAAATGVRAQCNFDGSPKAKGGKFSMVRAFAGCPSPNAQLGDGTPACAPPETLSYNYLFDQKIGSCQFKAKAKREDPCSFNSVTSACVNVSVSVKCKGILHDNGVTKINGVADAGWVVHTLARTTLHDENGGCPGSCSEFTTLDFPVDIGMSIPVNGSISVTTDTNHILNDIGRGSFPACSQVELLDLSVHDPQGHPFAVLGYGTR